MKYLVPIEQFERDVYFNLRFITKYLLSLKFILDEPLRLSKGHNVHPGYVIIYMADVPKTVVLYETAFALKRWFSRKIAFMPKWKQVAQRWLLLALQPPG